MHLHNQTPIKLGDNIVGITLPQRYTVFRDKKYPEFKILLIDYTYTMEENPEHDIVTSCGKRIQSLLTSACITAYWDSSGNPNQWVHMNTTSTFQHLYTYWVEGEVISMDTEISYESSIL